MPIAPKKYRTIAAARAGREQGKLRKPRPVVDADTVGVGRFRIYDATGDLRLDLPLKDAIAQLCKAVGFQPASVYWEAT